MIQEKRPAFSNWLQKAGVGISAGFVRYLSLYPGSLKARSLSCPARAKFGALALMGTLVAASAGPAGATPSSPKTSPPQGGVRPEDTSQCLEMLFERKMNAEGEALDDEDHKKLKILFRLMEDQCQGQRFDEAQLSAETLDILINFFLAVSRQHYIEPERFILLPGQAARSNPGASGSTEPEPANETPENPAHGGAP